MWEQKVLYTGNSSGLLDYDAFLQFMKGKGLHIPYRNNPLFRKEIYVIEPATTLIYTARKRMVPKGLDLWAVTVTLSGYGVSEVEKILDLQAKSIKTLSVLECFS